MSTHYDITFTVAQFCASRKVSQEDAVKLTREVLHEAGQLELHDDHNDDKTGIEETKAEVAEIYASVKRACNLTTG